MVIRCPRPGCKGSLLWDYGVLQCLSCSRTFTLADAGVEPAERPLDTSEQLRGLMEAIAYPRG